METLFKALNFLPNGDSLHVPRSFGNNTKLQSKSSTILSDKSSKNKLRKQIHLYFNIKKLEEKNIRNKHFKSLKLKFDTLHKKIQEGNFRDINISISEINASVINGATNYDALNDIEKYVELQKQKITLQIQDVSLRKIELIKRININIMLGGKK